MCGVPQAFEREKYLKDQIQSIQVKSMKCDFYNYRVAPRRRQRLHQHMLRKHSFPTKPSLCVDSNSASEPAVNLPVRDLIAPETDLIRLEAPPASSMDATFASEAETLETNCSLVNVYVNQTQSQAPALPDPLTPCMDESPPSPLPFSDFEAESFTLFSAPQSRPTLPSVQSG